MSGSDGADRSMTPSASDWRLISASSGESWKMDFAKACTRDEGSVSDHTHARRTHPSAFAGALSPQLWNATPLIAVGRRALDHATRLRALLAVDVGRLLDLFVDGLRVEAAFAS